MDPVIDRRDQTAGAGEGNCCLHSMHLSAQYEEIIGENADEKGSKCLNCMNTFGVMPCLDPGGK